MRTRRNNDRMLLESLVRKYGKSNIKNVIMTMNESFDTESYINVGIIFWKDDSGYWAYVDEQNYSGYKCSGSTLDEILEDLKIYLEDRLIDDGYSD